MNYDGVIEMAELLGLDTKEARQSFTWMLGNLSDDELIDTLESCREVLFDNQGDELLSKQVVRLIEVIQAEQSSRVVSGSMGRFLNLFKKK